MQTADNFINWLEGYLDASSNKLTVNQVKFIRKKIEEVRLTNVGPQLLFDSRQPLQITERLTNPVKPQASYDEFIKEVERNRGATTLEELS
jgi:hypothetical protein